MPRGDAARTEWLARAAVAAAAVAAALLTRPAVFPEQLHDPRHHAAFRAAADRLPVLEAVHVHSDRANAASRLSARRRPGVVEVLDPRPVLDRFERVRLLQADRGELRAVLDALERGELPAAIPPRPPVERYFVHARGPIACSALLEDPSDPAAVRRIRGILPGARLTGDPVARSREHDRAGGIVRALLLLFGAAVACGAHPRLRRGAFDDARAGVERRLFAALAALVATGAFAGGADVATVLAAAVVFGAPGAGPLLLGAALLAWPVPAVTRLGLALAVGGLARLDPAGWRARTLRLEPRRILLALVPAVLLVAAAFAARPAGRAPDAARTGRAARIGAEPVARPDAGLLPPPVRTPDHRRLLRGIHREATRLAERADDPARRAAFAEVARAASVEEPYLPRALAARVATRDGHPVEWAEAAAVVDDPAWTGPGLYRRRGDREWRRASLHGTALAVALALLAAAVFPRREPGPRGAAAAARVFAPLAAFLLLARAEAFDPVLGLECALPLLLVVALRPSRVWMPALAGAGLALPSALGWPAAALIVASAPAWLPPAPGTALSPR